MFGKNKDPFAVWKQKMSSKYILKKNCLRRILYKQNWIWAILQDWRRHAISETLINSKQIKLWANLNTDGDCSHEIKRRLLLGRKVMTNLDSIFKSRDITLPTKVRLVKAMVFPVVMYGCENWTVKKAECRRIDAFELQCWRRLLRVPWTAKR